MEKPKTSWSIRWKTATSASGILALAVGTLLWHFTRSQEQDLMDGIQAKITTVANMLSWSLITAVDAAGVTMDVRPIEEIIESASKGAKQDEDLEYIRVEDTSGSRMAGIEDASVPLLEPLPSSEPGRIKGDMLHKVVKISKQGTPLGVLRMGYSLRGIHSKMQSRLLTGLIFGIIIFLIGSGFAFLLGHRIARPLRTMTSTFKRMADGDLRQDLLRDRRMDEIGLLAGAFNDLLLQLKEISQQAQRISHGDLSRSISTKGDLAEAFLEMTNSIVDITSKFNELASSIDLRTSEILATARQQEAGAAQQAATVSEVTSTMEELAATARQIANNAESVTRSAEHASRAVSDGREALFAFVQSMNSIETGNKTINDNIIGLNRHVQQIRGIIDLINDIADRTDLLALNAALEGTKAGEAGKGFLLVAAEMRRLAENVFSSTAEIKQLISEVTEATNATVMANESGLRATKEGAERAGEAERAFGRIVDTIQETSKAAKQISLATQQQHTGTDQIVSAMGEVSSVAQQGVEGIRATTQSVSELSATTSKLKLLVGKYRSSPKDG